MKVYFYMWEKILYYKALGYQVGSIGRTVLGEEIPYIRIGKSSKNTAIVVASIHAREYVTSAVVLDMIEYYSGDASIYIVPMLDIDGVRLVDEGLSVIPTSYHQFLLDINGSDNFSQYKANIRGVDLGVNFPANWGEGTLNITYPSSANYIGPYPASEVETQAIMAFVEKINPKVLLNYHTKGEVIYTGYREILQPKFQAALSAITGYLAATPSYNSVGGLKDWYVLNRYGLGGTLEVGNIMLQHPISLDLRWPIVEQNKGIYNYLGELLSGEDNAKSY